MSVTAGELHALARGLPVGTRAMHPVALILTADRVSHVRREWVRLLCPRGQSALIDVDPGEEAMSDGEVAACTVAGRAPSLPAGQWCSFAHCLLLACRHAVGLPAPTDVRRAAAHYAEEAAEEAARNANL